MAFRMVLPAPLCRNPEVRDSDKVLACRRIEAIEVFNHAHDISAHIE